MRLIDTVLGFLALALLALFFTGCGAPHRDASRSDAPATEPLFPREEPFARRDVRFLDGERWIGNGVAYGPYRDGQYPGGPSPARAQLRNDLQLMSQHWNLLRVYGSAGPSETLLDIIREDGFDMQVMLGIWIAVEERRDSTGVVLEWLPEMRAGNRREIETAVRLARTYPDIVTSINVGNETQVFWSAHRSSAERLVAYVREVRARTTVPVTVADDFNFWNKPESHAVARELDFLVVHAHPLWNGIVLEEALAWTTRTLDAVQSVHPDHVLVLGETGWATRKHDVGEQARLIRGQPGEAQQAVFYDALTAWAAARRVPAFFFSAFDENWKGGEHPDEVEKHWGLFRADRTPKQALARRTAPTERARSRD